MLRGHCAVPTPPQSPQSLLCSLPRDQRLSLGPQTTDGAPPPPTCCQCLGSVLTSLTPGSSAADGSLMRSLRKQSHVQTAQGLCCLGSRWRSSPTAHEQGRWGGQLNETIRFSHHGTPAHPWALPPSLTSAQPRDGPPPPPLMAAPAPSCLGRVGLSRVQSEPRASGRLLERLWCP